jgi:hypothetical protein
MQPRWCYIARMKPARRLLVLLACEFGFIIVLASLGDLRSHVPWFLVLFAGAALCGWLAAVQAARRKLAVWSIIAVAIALRIPMFFTQPSLSDDVWRYIHDGRAQLAGVNPYAFAPAAAGSAQYRGPEFSRINHRELPTIYPPGAQYAFRLAAWFEHSLLAWRILLVAAEIVIMLCAALLLARQQRPIGNVAVYAWHPLAIIESIGSAHLEPLAIAFLMVALLALLGGRHVSAGAALAASVAVKLIAAPLLLLALNRRVLASFAALFTLCYLPFLSEGINPLGSLATFAERWESNGSSYPLIAPLIGARLYRWLAAGLLIGLIWRLQQRGQQPGDVAFYYLLALFALAPVVHPWYLLWLLAPLCLRARPFDGAGLAAFMWTVTVTLAYVAHWEVTKGGSWHVPTAFLLLEYIPLFAILGFSAFKRLSSREGRDVTEEDANAISRPRQLLRVLRVKY